MFHGTRPGWIEVITGVMFSGKSEELIRRVRRAAIARKRAARTGRNPKTGGVIQIKASIAPAFRAGKQLKMVVNNKMK